METILIVEDEEIIRKLNKEYLGKFNYRVIEASNGLEAIEVVTDYNGKIDLVLLDTCLPDMSADEVFKRIIAARPDLKVILNSCAESEAVAKDILDKGAHGLINKPYPLVKLSRELKQMFDRS